MSRSSSRKVTAVPTSSGATGTINIETARFRISRVAFATGVLPSHYHDRACLSVVLSGSFTEFLGNRRIDCRRGGLLLKPAMERHRDDFYGSEQIIIEPHAQAMRDIGDTPKLFEQIAYIPSALAAAIAARIAHELELVDVFTPLAVEGLTLELIAGAVGRDAVRTRPRRAPSWLVRVRDRLDDDASLPAVQELAALAEVHQGYLARRFREYYGLSIGRYARHVRLIRAARRLTDSDEPLSAIAAEMGFADQSHFTRAFRLHWGVTPRQYRLATRKT